MLKETIGSPLARKPASDAVGATAQSLPAMVAERMLQDILQGVLPPGTRLTEIALSEQHAVSRATIREALAQLERHHFIERVPRYGARVAQVDLSEVEELFEIRASLLALAAVRATRHAGDEDLARFDAMVGELEALAADDATPAMDYSQGVYAVQSRLTELSASRWLATLYEQIAGQTIWRAMVRHRGIGFATPARRRASAAHWRGVADAILARDPAACEAATHRLMDASLQFMQEQLSLPRTARRRPGAA